MPGWTVGCTVFKTRATKSSPRLGNKPQNMMSHFFTCSCYWLQWCRISHRGCQKLPFGIFFCEAGRDIFSRQHQRTSLTSTSFVSCFFFNLLFSWSGNSAFSSVKEPDISIPESSPWELRSLCKMCKQRCVGAKGRWLKTSSVEYWWVCHHCSCQSPTIHRCVLRPVDGSWSHRSPCSCGKYLTADELLHLAPSR